MPYDITQFSPGYGGIIDSSGNLKNIADGITVSGSQIVVTGGVDQATAAKPFTFQNATSTNQNGTPAFVDGYTTLIVQTTISGTITVNFEGSYDGITYSSIYGQPYSQGGNQTLSVSAAGTLLWAFNIAGLKYVQMRTSGASGSPSATVIGSALQAPYQWKPATSNLGASDGQNAGLIIQPTGSYLFGFNGTSWDRLQVDANKYLKTVVSNYVTPSADGVGVGANTSSNGSYLYGFNGSTWDRFRNNVSGTILASAARTSTTTSSLQTNYNHRGIFINLNISVASGTGGLQIAIQVYDSVSASYKTLNTLATAITATGLYTVHLYPSIDNVNSAITQTISQALPQLFRVQVTHGDTSSYTYSCTIQYIL